MMGDERFEQFRDSSLAAVFMPIGADKNLVAARLDADPDLACAFFRREVGVG